MEGGVIRSNVVVLRSLLGRSNSYLSWKEAICLVNDLSSQLIIIYPHFVLFVEMVIYDPGELIIPTLLELIQF